MGDTPASGWAGCSAMADPGLSGDRGRRKRVASLPSLPEDWQPSDPRLQAVYRKVRTS